MRSPQVGSQCSLDETEIRTPGSLFPCMRLTKPGLVSSNASLGLLNETQIVSGFRQGSEPLLGQIQHRGVCFVCRLLCPETSGACVVVERSSPTGWTSGRLRRARARPGVYTGCLYRLVLTPTYSRFSYTEGPAVDGSKYLSLLVSTCGRGRYVGKIVGVRGGTWSELRVQQEGVG